MVMGIKVEINTDSETAEVRCSDGGWFFDVTASELREAAAKLEAAAKALEIINEV